jgi:hypothetical protein
LGWVGSEDEFKRDLIIRAGGSYHKEVNFKPIKIHPDDLLRVSLGKTFELKDGNASLTPLTIEIPKGSPPANFMGSGEAKYGQIMLETNHPKAPELRILVRFAVEG